MTAKITTPPFISSTLREIIGALREAYRSESQMESLPLCLSLPKPEIKLLRSVSPCFQERKTILAFCHVSVFRTHWVFLLHSLLPKLQFSSLGERVRWIHRYDIWSHPVDQLSDVSDHIHGQNTSFEPHESPCT